MGASLYIDRFKASARTRTDAVNSTTEFRDSYNATNVLWTCGLSWWSDLIPLLNDDLELTGENLVGFRNRVAASEQRLPTAAEIAAYGVPPKPTGRYSLEWFHRYHVRKRNKLLRFLDLAIEHGLPIVCSL